MGSGLQRETATEARHGTFIQRVGKGMNSLLEDLLTGDEAILDRLPDPIFLVDRQGHVAYANRACESWLRVSRADAVGKPLVQVLNSSLDEGLAGLLGPPPQQVTPTNLPAVRFGDRLWDVRVTPFADQVTAVHCMPAASGESGWPPVVADSADAIWALDRDDRIVAWNRGAQEMFGYASAEIVGQPLTRLIPADLLAEREPQRLRKALRELGAVRDYQTRRLTKDGREVEVSLTRTLLRNRGESFASSTIVRDLSQRRQIERQMIESEKLVTLGQLAASVAQEIGAPLTTIGIAVEHLRRCGCQSDECDFEKHLATVNQQLKRIARLTHGLVELAKPGELKISRIQVSAVIDRALELLGASLRRAKVKVVVENEAEKLKIQADAGQLQQVFLNLLMNAQRALESQGGGCVNVKTELERGLPMEGHPLRSVVRIELSDDGPGIEPADLHYIFAPFFSRSGGSGLGLALAKQIIHAHGGTIEASSAPGQGATFTLQLPVEAT